jgi:hypothetical protein
MSEIIFRYCTDASIPDIHTCVKVYTSCQSGAFFTKCTIRSLIRPTKSEYWVEREQSPTGSLKQKLTTK